MGNKQALWLSSFRDLWDKTKQGPERAEYNEEKDFGVHTSKIEEQYAIMLKNDVPMAAQYGRTEPRTVVFYATPG